jgi:hypothetical protein
VGIPIKHCLGLATDCSSRLSKRPYQSHYERDAAEENLVAPDLARAAPISAQSSSSVCSLESPASGQGSHMSVEGPVSTSRLTFVSIAGKY